VADQKITQLNSLAAADAQATVDVLPVADVSTSETKKITVAAAVTAGLGSVSNNTIPAAKLVDGSVTSTQLDTAAVATANLADSSVTTAKINDDAVTTAKIAAGAVTATEIATDAVTATQLADNAVDTGAIAATAVTTAKIADDAVTNAKIAAAAVGTAELVDASVTSAKVATSAIATAQIQDDAVTNAKLAALSVGTTELIDGAVTADKLAAGAIASVAIGSNSINTENIVDGAVTAAKLATDAVGTTNVADDAITTAKLADGSVTNEKIGAGAVGTTELGNSSVTAAKIAASTITSAVIASGAIGTTQVADGAITTAKIAASAVGSSQIAADAITATQIADNAVGADQIAAAGVGTSEIADGSVTTAKLADGAVTTPKIADAAVTSAKLGTGAVNTTALGAAAVTTAKVADAAITSAKLADDLDGSEFLAQSANVVLAGPASGASAVPTFRALTATDVPLLGDSNLPVASNATRGTVIVGTGLSADGSGVLSIANTVSGATATKISFNGSGLITASANLEAADIPSLDTSKITTGTFGSSLIGTGAVTGAKLANESTVQFGGSGSTAGVVTFPTAQFKGQYFYDELNQDLYIWSGSAWLPITIISGELVFAGTYDASVNQVDSVTSAGSAAGLTVSAALPAAAESNNRYYLVVSESGTGTGNAPAEALAPPDMILSNGSSWELIDVSNAIAGQTAANISFTPYGDIAAINVQTAIQELDDEKVGGSNPTFSGNVTLDSTAVIVFEGSTADDYETTLTCVDPTSDHTITLPNVTGTVVTTGDTGSVTSTMIADGTIVNADINANAGIAFSKLANLTSGNILVGSSGNVPTSVAVTGDVTISNTGVTSIASGVIVNADINASAAIAGSKIQAATTSNAGAVQLTDSTSSTSTTTAATPNSVKTAYDLANAAAKYDDTTANFTGTLQNGGSNVLVDTDIGSTVQAYDADTAKLDVVQTFTAVQTLTDPAIVGTILEDVYTISDGAAFEVDPGNGSVQLITLGANRTPKATNFAAGEAVTLMIDDGTAYTLTWTDATWGTSGVVWTGGSAPTLATTGYTVVQFWKVGTQVYGAYVGDVA